MTLDDLIEELTALRARSPAAGVATVVATHWTGRRRVLLCVDATIRYDHGFVHLFDEDGDEDDDNFDQLEAQ